MKGYGMLGGRRRETGQLGKRWELPEGGVRIQVAGTPCRHHSALPKLSKMAISSSKASGWTPPDPPQGNPEAASWPLGFSVQGDSDTSHVWV